MLSLDVVTIFLAMLAFHWVGQDWFGLALPGMRAPHPQIMAILSTCACMLVAMVNGSRRFDDATRVGMPEAVLRWLVTQQIITAAEVSAVVTSPIRIRREL
ncbi:hypothetical protein FKV24_002265 [Lysobacter maris]|uniref:Uncharacterized protein n=1 Tax=Marilutibacter maris TaxID=1605891 RepID=A0A508BC10_9GAMM|nr:hypothetical protein [Lysobacter maris]KAB8198403.1 hypothetical protein FKV24_002265 [Lysobacter maris]